MRRTLASLAAGLLISAGMAACATAKMSDEAATRTTKVTVPSGTYITVVLEDGISTEKSSPGDSFNGSLGKDVVVDGLTVFQKGSAAHGRVVDVQEPGRVKGLAQLKLVLTSVEHNGKVVPIETQMYVGIARNTKKRDAEVIGGAAGIGAAIGAIAGGGKGAAAGAAIGGGAGTGTVLATKGNQLHYPPETRLLFTLASPVQV